VNELQLLSDVIDAAGRANTRRALALRLGEALGRHLDFEGDALDVLPRLARRNVQSAALADALVKVVALAERHCQLVERVAELSRRAHGESASLRRQLEAARSGDEIVARSPVMLAVLERADLVASHDTTVLLLGESGTGKELLARRIHARSRRASGPFVQVNCGAIPGTLVESELFGHEKGAFTGASARHVGLFERASGGTLLLDEIGELPRSVQVKLLRVLQEGRIERVGGERPVRVDVRVLAATHRPLAALVKKGAFRADLFYRLAVFPIEIPPLRERRDDIPALVHRLLETLSARLDVPVPSVSPATLARLVEGEWPGNVRELANVLERALILSRGGELAIDERAPEAGRARAPSRAVRTLEEATRECIETALAASRGRIYGPDGAAARLGLRPSTLQSKMRKHGISRARFAR
jgi:transcriptional regulator with GAF, ATPase, and Fis domain